MTITDATQLISTNHINGTEPQQWADIGCGDGLFSKALLTLLPKGSTIYAIDKRRANIKEAGIRFIQLDFESDPLPLPPLNGLMMTNALHFVKNQPAFLQNTRKHLLPAGHFILVEYDTDTANRWVPYPLSFTTASGIFQQAGFEHFEKINEHPSVYQRAGMYAAHCIKR